MEKIILKATLRENFGKNECKHLRKEKQIPGIIYKSGKENVSIQVDNKDLWNALHTEAGENAIITMDISGGKKPAKKTVIVKDVQLDPVKDTFLHVDFHEISLTEKIKVNVPVVIKGEAIGVREEEGVLGQILWELEVECLPTEIPEHIDIHVGELRIGDSIHVKDITPPDHVVILDDPEQALVTISPPTAEEAVEEEVSAEEAEEPEVIKKGKAEEEEGEASAEEES